MQDAKEEDGLGIGAKERGLMPRRIVIIGCGGIGSWLIDPLLCFLQGEGFKRYIALWDGDRYEAGNSVRQMFKPGDLSVNKAEAQAIRCRDLYPALRLLSYDEYVTKRTIERAMQEDDVVFSCVDNHPCRKLLALRADKMINVALITAGNEMTDGNVHLTLVRDGRHLTTPLLERHPEIATTKAGDRAKASCQQRIANGETQLLVTNHEAAALAFQVFHRIWGLENYETLPEDTYFDVKKLQVSSMEVHPNVPAIAVSVASVAIATPG